jgi:ubiquitin carboxyl-terminal hydrolase L5
LAAARQKKRNQQRVKARTDKSNDGSAYHFIAFVPVGQQVWQLDGLTSTPVCIGKSPNTPQISITTPLTWHGL